jgi:IS30 family transposase
MSRHLTYEERCQISSYQRNGFTQTEIASLIGRLQSVISRELRRNSIESEYDGVQAQKKAELRQAVANARRKKMTFEVMERIQELLRESDASPEQISGRLKKLHGIQVSHETIYQFIWKDKSRGGTLYEHLRHRAKKYNKRSGKNAGRGLIPNRVDIDQRPAIVELKERVGDFELDTVVGAKQRGVIVTAVDRASKYSLFKREFEGTAINVENAICTRLAPFAQLGFFHTATSDNGKEFSNHESMVQRLGGAFFFAKPYHSWERGLNEHTNGLLRQYFPKGTDFTTISDENLAAAEWKINNRPRKILNYQTPAEALSAMMYKQRQREVAIM